MTIKPIYRAVRLLANVKAFRGRTKMKRRRIRENALARLTRGADAYVYRAVRLIANIAAFRGRSKTERREIRQKTFMHLLPDAASASSAAQPYDLEKLSIMSPAMQDGSFLLLDANVATDKPRNRTFRFLSNVAAFRGRSKTERREIRKKTFAYWTRKADTFIYRAVRLLANSMAFLGRSKMERRQIRQKVFMRFLPDAIPGLKAPQPYDFEKLSAVSVAMQDLNFPLSAMHAERLLVVVVPEHNAMSGGIYSMFSIASHLRRIKRIHGYEVVVMTRPQKAGLTYFRNTNFINSENVFRFSRLAVCDNLKELYLHIPEYVAETFLEDLSSDERAALKRVETLRINILNQNVKLMPEPAQLRGLRTLTSDLTQSVAHHAYFCQEEADRYNLPTLLLPAYTDLSAYPAAPFVEKEKLIIYSPDAAPHKTRCLRKIRETLPDFELVEIRDIAFDEFMDLATRCMFSITFGEGFDGYLAQPIHQGGIGFAVFEEEFFPSDHFKNYYNIFADPEQMVAEICDRMRYLEANCDDYDDLNRKWVAEYDKLYDYAEYQERIRMLAMREFEILPNLH